ncbi:MAG: HAD family hydrolase [Alistipes indistinctus]
MALIYDFDGTLSPGNMPGSTTSSLRWAEQPRGSGRRATRPRASRDGDPILAYMYRMLHEAKSSGKSLRYEARAVGRAYRAVRRSAQWFSRINAYGASKGLEIHHFINSSGLREMIEGTPIAHEFRKIYACSFLYDVDGVAYWPAVAVNYTNKTQFIFKINKGIESVYDSHRINSISEEEERPVPFRRMIYFGDGTTDIPVCGWSSGREDTLDRRLQSLFGRNRQTSERLLHDQRVNYVCPADYRVDRPIDRLVHAIIDRIASDENLRKFYMK